jgi:hypothetical protein
LKAERTVRCGTYMIVDERIRGKLGAPLRPLQRLAYLAGEESLDLSAVL